MTYTLSDIAPLQGVARRSFLEKAGRLRLASALPGGAIAVSPAWFVVVDDAVYVPLDPTAGDPAQSLTPDARHIDVLEAGGRVSAVVDEGDEISNVRAVQLEGTAKAVTDPELVELLLDLVAEKYFHIGHPHLEYYFSAGAVAARRWFRIVPERTDGWDLRVLPQPPIQDLLRFPEHLLSGS